MVLLHAVQQNQPITVEYNNTWPSHLAEPNVADVLVLERRLSIVFKKVLKLGKMLRGRSLDGIVSILATLATSAVCQHVGNRMIYMTWQLNASDTHSQNLNQTCACRLIQETCICVGQSCASFFLVQVSWSQKLSGMWHEPCDVIGHRLVVVQETVTNLRQIFQASSFLHKFLKHESQLAGILMTAAVEWDVTPSSPSHS